MSRRFVGRLLAAVVGATLLGIAVIALLPRTATTPSPSPGSDLGLPDGGASEFPDPAFLVNGEPVSGQALARSVAVIELQARQLGTPVDHRAAIEQAVERLAVQVRLRQMAEARGYSVSDEELEAHLADVVAEAKRSGLDPGDTPLLAGAGYTSWEEYVADPAVRTEYRNALLVGKLIDELLAANPDLADQDLQAFALADAKIEFRFSP
ncbi:MAG TPA: hypothetical protein VNO86_05835 [Candidatus Binatia bacterium]|nr:hypothetical protein [Candidatus Binatia bacterium]